MVVPYIRNPSRHRSTPVAIKTKSQYHLEPDHASIHDGVLSSSTYQHVGRRTKGGTGGGYLYSSSSSQYNSNSSDEGYSGDGTLAGAIVGYVILGIFGLIIAVGIILWLAACFMETYRSIVKRFRRKRQLHRERQIRRENVRRLEQQARQREETQFLAAEVWHVEEQVQEAQIMGADDWHLRLSERYVQSGDPEAPNLSNVPAELPEYSNTIEASNMEEVLKDMDRMRLIRSKLHYQVVLPDKSNVTAKSMRNNSNTTDVKADDATEASDDDDDDSIIGADETKALSGKKPAAKKNASKSSSSSFFTLRNFLSFRPIRHDDCSICLECFDECQTICVAKNSCCNHVFHEECIESWLMDHDHCPNCRSNMIE